MDKTRILPIVVAGVVLFYVWRLSASGRGMVDYVVMGLVGLVLVRNVGPLWGGKGRS